ncbi:MAG: VOC family protein [Gemmatimonadales bacterium]
MTTLAGHVVPSLLVRDMAATLAFYRQLGFELTGRSNDTEPPTWAEVRRDAASLQFFTDPPHGTPTSPVMSGTLYFSPTSVDALAAEFRAAGIEFEWGPEVMDYGMKEFAVRDPNAYLLAFSEPVPPPPSARAR